MTILDIWAASIAAICLVAFAVVECIKRRTPVVKTVSAEEFREHMTRIEETLERGYVTPDQARLMLLQRPEMAVRILDPDKQTTLVLCQNCATCRRVRESMWS